MVSTFVMVMVITFTSFDQLGQSCLPSDTIDDVIGRATPLSSPAERIDAR
jgi:hypothetical protein